MRSASTAAPEARRLSKGTPAGDAVGLDRVLRTAGMARRPASVGAELTDAVSAAIGVGIGIGADGATDGDSDPDSDPDPDQAKPPPASDRPAQRVRVDGGALGSHSMSTRAESAGRREKGHVNEYVNVNEYGNGNVNENGRRP